MQDQLSLFPQRITAAEERQIAFARALDSELTAVDELLAIAGRCRRGREYAQLLDCLIRFPQYTIFNALLLYLQNPRVTRVATAGSWARRYNRRPRPDARPLIILAPMAPVLFVYDVGDIEGPPLTVPAPSLCAHGTTPLPEIFEKTRSNCELHGICLRQSAVMGPEPEAVVRLTAATRKRYRALDPSPKASYLIVLDEQAAIGERYLNLVNGLAQIFCGHYGIDANAWWPERAALSTETEEIEARSVAYLISGRNGTAGAGGVFLSPFRGADQHMPPFSLNAVIQAAGYIEEMGKHKWAAPRKKSRYKT